MHYTVQSDMLKASDEWIWEIDDRILKDLVEWYVGYRYSMAPRHSNYSLKGMWFISRYMERERYT